MDHANDGQLILPKGNGQRPSSSANNNQQQQQPRTILAEEDYTSTLSHIVTRDYFPSLHSLRRDAAILDARRRGDIAGAVAVRRTARREEMEREREWKEEKEEEERALNEETALVKHDGRTASATGLGVRKRPRPLKHETITGFHARVTSEDNAEFEMNQERERKEREKNLGVVYAARADRGGRLLIESCVNSDGSSNVNNNTTGEEEMRAKNAAISKNARALLCDTPLGLSSDLYDAPPSAGLRITDGGDNGGDTKKDGSSNGIGRNGLFFQPQHHSNNNQPNPIINGTSNRLLLTSGAPSSGGTFLSLENGTSSQGGGDEENDKDAKRCDNLLMPPPPARLPAASSSSMVPYEQSTKEQSSKSNNADDAKSTTTPTIDNRCQLVEYLPKPALPDIHPPATRFPYQNESRLLAKNSNSLIPTNVSGRGNGAYATDATSASDVTDLDASPRPLDRERAAHRKARRRECETFVAMTPLIQPGGGGGDSSGPSQCVGGVANRMDEEPIMTWGDVASTPLVLGSGSAVDGASTSAADWEPTRPASLSANMDAESSSGPAFDVVDNNRREALAGRAERGLHDRANTYRAAGTSALTKKRRKEQDDDESSVCSARSSKSSVSSASSALDRTASLTPAARALLEASNKSHASRRKKSRTSSSRTSSSRIFQTSSSASKSSFGTCGIHAGSKDSFGSALRMSYDTPKSATPRSGRTGSQKRKGISSSSSSSLRRAVGGATPRCHTLR